MALKTRLVIGFKDDIGLERDNMEDAAGYSMAATSMDVRRKGAIFVVADGVGGNQAGEVASKRAVNTILKEYYSCPFDDTEASLRHAINQANDLIFKEARDSGKETMATTVVCAVIRDGNLTLANVGDSRTYLLRTGKIRQLTEDHSWVNEQIRLGLISEDEAKENPYRNVITRSLGNKPKVEADITTLGSLLDNDLLILCSDGMYEGVSEEEMVEITRRLPSVQAAEELVDQAKRGGSTDNITVMIVETHLTGEIEGVPIPIETQKPAAREPDTQPNRVVARTVEMLETPVEKPEEPPKSMASIQSIYYREKEEPQPQVEQAAKTESENRTEPVHSSRTGSQDASSISGNVPPFPAGSSTSQPSTIRSFLNREEEPLPGTSETDVSLRRRFYWEWTADYRSSGTQDAVKLEKVVKLPDGSQVVLTFMISKSHFIEPVHNKTYNHPLAFYIKANHIQNGENHTKSKVIMGLGFYNISKDRVSLNKYAKKDYEIIISADEIYLLKREKPTIFATIDVIEFENMHDHKVEEDFLTILQVKVHYHIIL